MTISEETEREVERRAYVGFDAADIEQLAADAAFWADVPFLSTYDMAELEVALVWFRRGFISCMRRK